MKLHIATIIALASVILACSPAAKAQDRECEPKEKSCREHCGRKVARPHIHGPLIIRNSRYNNSYKHRNFRHQRSAYKNNWERRPYVDPR